MEFEDNKRDQAKVKGKTGLKQGRPRVPNYKRKKVNERTARKLFEKNPTRKRINYREPVYTVEELERIYIKPQWKVEDIKMAYCEFYNDYKSLSMLCRELKISAPTLKKYFAKITYELQLRQQRMGWDTLYGNEKADGTISRDD